MKNALIIVKNEENDLINTEINAVFKVFSANGYVFDDVRILRGVNENKTRSVLQSYVKEFDNCICLTQSTYFATIYTMVASTFKNGQAQIFGDSACCTDKEKTCFLFCEENAVLGLQNACIPYLAQKYNAKQESSVFRCVGANETHIHALIAKAKLIDEGKIRYVYSRQGAEDVIRLFYNENVLKRIADDVIRIFADGLADCLYAMDDTPLAHQLVNLLKLRGKKISVAESFTGGGIAKKITAVSGASAVYFEGLNTYNELSKIKRLGVSDYTLHSFGVISDNTAYEMAAGLIATGDCDLAIATTGLAGPNSDSSMLPVGLCYIAVGTKERVFVYRYKFDGSREKITETAIDYALFLAYKQLKNI